MCWVALESPCAFLCDCNWIYKSTINSKYLIFFLQNNHVVYWHHQQWACNNILFGVLSVIITTCQLKGLFYVSLKLASFWLSFRNIFLLSFFHFLYICENVLFISKLKMNDLYDCGACVSFVVFISCCIIYTITISTIKACELF